MPRATLPDELMFMSDYWALRACRRSLRTLGLIDDTFHAKPRTGMGHDKEMEMVRRVHELDLNAVPSA